MKPQRKDSKAPKKAKLKDLPAGKKAKGAKGGGGENPTPVVSATSGAGAGKVTFKEF